MANVDYNDENNHSHQRETSFRNAPSAQENFEATFANELPVFAEIFLNALETTLTELSGKSLDYQNRNSKANRMNENIRGDLFKEFPENMVALRDRFVFEKEDYILFFKKLGPNSKPHNVRTYISDRLLQQTIFDSKVLIFVGYQPDSNWDEILRMSAVYICQGSVVWVTDLREFMNGDRQAPIFPSAPAPDSPLIVRPKVISKAKSAANDAASQ